MMLIYTPPRDTEANWLLADPVIPKNVIVRTLPEGQFKVGTGNHKWSQLQYTDKLPESIEIRGIYR